MVVGHLSLYLRVISEKASQSIVLVTVDSQLNLFSKYRINTGHWASECTLRLSLLVIDLLLIMSWHAVCGRGVTIWGCW